MPALPGRPFLFLSFSFNAEPRGKGSGGTALTYTYQVTAQLPVGIELIALCAAVVVGIITLIGLAIWVVYRLAKRSPHLVQAFPQAATCAVCGLPMTWIAPQGRWYCSNCAQYR